jgi:cell division control protein 24
MQKYAQELSQSNTLDRDTIHLLFPNLNKLLNFQRRFLIRLEGTADNPWREQRWGILFTDNVSLSAATFPLLFFDSALMAMIL